MDENTVEGAATNVGGKVKDAVGGLLGDSKLQAEGKGDQLSGKVQNAYGSAKDAVEEGAQSLGSQIDDFLKKQPLTALLAAVGAGYLLRMLTHSRS